MPGVKTLGIRVFILLITVAVVYRTYKRWKAYRSIRRIAGKVVLITGASSGLGEAIARVLHSVGAKVILSGRNIQKLQQLKFSLDANVPSSVKVYDIVRHSPAVLELDLTEGHTLIDRAQSALTLFGHIDILINNAGVGSRSTVLETDVRIDRTVMETNFFGPIQLTKALLPAMLEQRHGQIVVISSLQGKLGLPLRSSYAASKHALHGYFDSLRIEVQSRGVTVNMICPGYIQTRLSVNALKGDGSHHGVTDKNTLNGLSAENVAYKILEAIASQERETVISRPLNHLAIYLKIIAPSLLDWILRKRAKLV